MVGEAGKEKTARRKPRLPRYFFLKVPRDGESSVLVWKLFGKLKIDRTNDIIYTWCYPDASRVAFTYSQVLKTYGPAFTLQEVCSMINRNRITVQWAIIRGDVPEPPYVYNLESKKKTKYLFHEEDILGIHEYFCGVHRGRPRNDGIIVPQRMPTRRELKGMIRHEQPLYVKEGDEYVPTWRAADF